MPIRITCPICGDKLIAPDNSGGKKAKCINCQHVLVLPMTPTVEETAQAGGVPDTDLPRLTATMDPPQRSTPPPMAIPKTVLGPIPREPSIPRVQVPLNPLLPRSVPKNWQNVWLIAGWSGGAAVVLGFLIWFSTPTRTTSTEPKDGKPPAKAPIQDGGFGEMPKKGGLFDGEEKIPFAEIPKGALVVPATLNGQLTNFDPLDPVRPGGTRIKIYNIHLKANSTYSIILESNQFDAYLRLEDDLGTRLAENDDGGPGFGLNSRIVYRANQNGTFKIFATSLGPATGNFRLLVREGIVGPQGNPKSGFLPKKGF